jgi:pSer/pThr/pTyr-binding forkhead associated (FHA) protein
LYPLKEGENRLGADPNANVRIPDLQADIELAISVEMLGSFAWAKGDSREIAINGSPLNKEPIPLFHGDRLSLNGSTLVFIDDDGEPTVHMQRPAPAAVASTVAESPQGTAAVEPHLLSRMTPPTQKRRVVAVLRRADNNQAYIVGRTGFRIGREKRCDLIIPDRSVSRLHAEIAFSGGQFLLRCLGRTSTKVNGRALDEPYKLRVGDVIQIGSYEFTFLRRPATAQEIVQASEVTPIRSAVAEAPTVAIGGATRGRLVFWFLFTVLAGLVGVILMGRA